MRSWLANVRYKIGQGIVNHAKQNRWSFMKRYFFYRAEIMVPNEGDPASFRQATQHACFANYSFGFRMTHQRVVNILMNELLHKNNYHLIKLDYFFKLSKEDHDKIVKACHEPLVVE